MQVKDLNIGAKFEILYRNFRREAELLELNVGVAKIKFDNEIYAVSSDSEVLRVIKNGEAVEVVESKKRTSKKGA